MILSNVEESARIHPDTFFISDKEEREGLELAQLCKLIFLSEDGEGERMWVRVTEVHKTRSGVRYVGELANVPLFLPMALGDPVEFGPEHVADYQSLEVYQ